MGHSTGAVKALRAPIQLLFGVFWIGLCALLWRPIPLTLSLPARAVAFGLGTPLYFHGLALYLWGARALGDMYAASSAFGVQLRREHQLITRGPFALVRHPLYLGLQLAAFGGLLLYRTWAFVFVAASFLALSIRARREEQALAMEFGEQWETYAERVPRWMPRLRRTG